MPETNEIFLYDEIGFFGVTANAFTSDLRGYSPNDVSLHLSSPGGEVFEGVVIYNALKAYPGNITVYIDGLAASIASVIALGGNRIVMAPTAKLMIHEASVWPGQMTADDAGKLQDRLNQTSDMIAGVYAERAGNDAAYWRDLMRAETWFTAKEAKAAGLIDEIGIDSMAGIKVAAKFDLSAFRCPPQMREAARLVEMPVETEEEAEETALNPEAIQNAVSEGIRTGVREAVAAIQAAIDAKRIDPGDAARRELEEALARVQL